MAPGWKLRAARLLGFLSGQSDGLFRGGPFCSSTAVTGEGSLWGPPPLVPAGQPPSSCLPQLLQGLGSSSVSPLPLTAAVGIRAGGETYGDGPPTLPGNRSPHNTQLPTRGPVSSAWCCPTGRFRAARLPTPQGPGSPPPLLGSPILWAPRISLRGNPRWMSTYGGEGPGHGSREAGSQVRPGAARGMRQNKNSHFPESGCPALGASGTYSSHRWEN